MDTEIREVESLRKRQHSPDDDHSCKRQNCPVTFKLESESDLHSDDSDSEYSVQDRDTASPHDPSDTSSSSESTQDEWDMTMEFDVASLSETKLMSDENSSGPDALMCAVSVLAATVVVKDEDVGFMADSSDSDSDSEVDSEVPRGDYWPCLRCHCKNNKPYFRFCEKCWQIRKGYFTERPKGRMRRQALSIQQKAKGVRQAHKKTSKSKDLQSTPSQSVDLQDPLKNPSQETSESISSSAYSRDLQDLQKSPSQETSESISSSAYSRDLQDLEKNPSQETSESISSSAYSRDLQDLQKNPSQETSESISSSAYSRGPCMFCMEQPKDGIFVHHECAHSVCCYKCAVKTWNKSSVCPFCRRTPLKILKLIWT